MRAAARVASRDWQDRMKVNGAELYYQVQGTGPVVLMIHGTGADSGCYEPLAALLASDFTVVTYDRRGWSRSPRPVGWIKTTVEEHADDAAWLLKAIGHPPVVVFGSSSGALIALDLILRHPDVVRGLIVHEPSLFTCLPADFVREQFAELSPIIEQAISAGGHRAAQQALLEAWAGDDGLEAIDTLQLERWLGNADVMFEYEFPAMLLGYQPDPVALAAAHVPVKVLRAAESHSINAAAAEWLAGQVNSELVTAAGAHLAYCTRPGEFAGTLHPLLEEVAGSHPAGA